MCGMLKYALIKAVLCEHDAAIVYRLLRIKVLLNCNSFKNNQIFTFI